MKHELALDRLSMTYSWYNIRSDHKNNTIKYTPDKGVSWQTITFTDTFISTGTQRIIKQLIQKERVNITSISLLFYQLMES